MINLADIEHIELFSGFDSDELKHLMRFISINHYAKGLVLFREGTKGRVMYAVKSGKVDIVKNYNGANETFVNVIKRGQVFGEISLFLDAPRNATALIAEDTELILVTSVILDNILRKKPEIAAKLLNKLLLQSLERVNCMDQRLVELESELRILKER